MKITAPPVDQGSITAAATITLGGDATGSPGTTTVVGIGGIPVDVSSPNDGDVLTYVLANADIELKPPAAGGLTSITDGTTTVSPATSATVPKGGVTNNGAGDAGLNFIPNVNGALEKCSTVAASGAAQTLNWATANEFDVTLTAGCTFTFSNVPNVAGNGAAIAVILRGSYTVTWPGSCTVLGTDPGTGTRVCTVFTTDGGTTFGVFFPGSGGATTLDALTDVTITAVATDDTLRYTGAAWTNDNRRWEPVTFDPGTGPEIVFTATDIVMTWETY